jgi:branched-chain amino acid aminotransferase
MSTSQTIKINVERASSSKIKDVDFDNLNFSSVFTDHMLECDYINGEWQTPTIKPYALSCEPFCQSFHYGQAIFLKV